jgi:hypothetical protein
VERRAVRGEEERSDDDGYGGLEKLRTHHWRLASCICGFGWNVGRRCLRIWSGHAHPFLDAQEGRTVGR